MKPNTLLRIVMLLVVIGVLQLFVSQLSEATGGIQSIIRKVV